MTAFLADAVLYASWVDNKSSDLFQVNLIDWLKTMVSSRNSDEAVDPKMPKKPTSRELKKALLVALRCVDPDASKRPRMGHVIHMLEVEDFPYRDVSQ
jgi:hypothetical protein